VQGKLLPGGVAASAQVRCTLVRLPPPSARDKRAVPPVVPESQRPGHLKASTETFFESMSRGYSTTLEVKKLDYTGINNKNIGWIQGGIELMVVPYSGFVYFRRQHGENKLISRDI
jgi:hypothetical protein